MIGFLVLCVLTSFEIVIVSYSKLMSPSSIAKYSAGLSLRLDKDYKEFVYLYAR